MQRSPLLHSLLTVILVLAGLAAARDVTVHDYLDREVSLAAPPERIVSLMPSHTETLLELGGADLLVALDTLSPQPGGTDLPLVGDGFSPNLERIIELEPDLVLTDAYSGAHEQLADLGVTVFAGTPENVADMLDFVELLGGLTGFPEEAAAVRADLEEKVAEMEERAAGTAGPTVYVELDPEPFSAGPGSYIDDLLVIVGARNIVPEELGAWPLLSREFIISADPEVILLLDAPWGESEATLRERPGFAELSGRVVEAGEREEDLLSRPGPHLGEALDWLYAALYPDAAGE